MPSPPGRKDLGPRDHERSLKALCACCGRKRNLRDVTDMIASLIRQYAIPSYTLGSNYCPKRVCSTCVLTLYEFRKNSMQTLRKFPPLMEYECLLWPSLPSLLLPATQPELQRIISAKSFCLHLGCNEENSDTWILEYIWNIPLSKYNVSIGVLLWAEKTFLRVISSTLSSLDISFFVLLYQVSEFDSRVERSREFQRMFAALKW